MYLDLPARPRTNDEIIRSLRQKNCGESISLSNIGHERFVEMGNDVRMRERPGREHCGGEANRDYKVDGESLMLKSTKMRSRWSMLGDG